MKYSPKSLAFFESVLYIESESPSSSQNAIFIMNSRTILLPMKQSLFVALIGFIIAFSGFSPNAFSQSLVDQHVAATIDFDMNESPICDLASTQTPNEYITCDDDFGCEIIAIEKEPSPIPLLISKTEDPEQFFF